MTWLWSTCKGERRSCRSCRSSRDSAKRDAVELFASLLLEQRDQDQSVCCCYRASHPSPGERRGAFKGKPSWKFSWLLGGVCQCAFARAGARGRQHPRPAVCEPEANCRSVWHRSTHYVWAQSCGRVRQLASLEPPRPRMSYTPLYRAQWACLKWVATSPLHTWRPAARFKHVA